MKPKITKKPNIHSQLNDEAVLSLTSSPALLDLLSIVPAKTHNSVVITDARRKIIWVNDAFTKNTGYTLSEAKGKVPGHILQGKGTDKKTVDWMRKKLNEKEPFECEIFNYTKEGKKLWFKINVQPVFNKKNELVNFLGIASNITRQKELEHILEDQRVSEQKKLLQTSIEAQEKERNAIGWELHDNINQLLGVAVLYNGMIRTEVNHKELIRKQAEILQICISEIRTLSHRLVTPSLRRDFGEEIKNLVSNTLPSYLFDVKLELTSTITKKLPPEVQLHLFRILQEQMTNILKHSSAVKIFIRFKFSKGSLILSIEDNGVGADPTAASQGIGLTNISNRVKLINADVTIKTAPGKGFSLIVEIPFMK
ncbi:MAG: PAS domain-containing protein [Lacibacter sp.]